MYTHKLHFTKKSEFFGITVRCSLNVIADSALEALTLAANQWKVFGIECLNEGYCILI